MNDFEALSSELPAPRDDEPARLRQDILDELADHLACSYNRELLRGADPGEARRGYLGIPRRVPGGAARDVQI